LCQRWEILGDERWGRAYKLSWRNVRVVFVFYVCVSSVSVGE